MIVVVAGTGTNIGKTWVTAAVAGILRERGVEVHARKPVQSFAPGDPTTDADLLAAATGEARHAVCPEGRWLSAPFAPPMAAEVLGLPPFTIADLVGGLSLPAAGVTFVESAGGVRSPLASDGDTASLVDALAPARVLLVADAELGTINLVRLSVAALVRHRVVTFLNGFDPSNDLHLRNADWMRTREGLEIVTDLEALVAYWIVLTSR